MTGAPGVIAGLLLLAGAAPAAGQTLAQRVAQVLNGEVRLSFAAREGVCGNGHNIYTARSSEHWEPACARGPVRVVLAFRAGVLVDVDTWVGGRWRVVTGSVVDLGTVSAPDAAHLLLRLAQDPSHRAGENAILPATLADSVTVWPELLRIARNTGLRRDTRRGAVFWLGQAAGDAAAADLTALVDNPDREVQESAVFALSQLRDGGGVEPLIRIARTHRDPEIRKKAMFWLGQSRDPRALELFEELLLGR